MVIEQKNDGAKCPPVRLTFLIIFVRFLPRIDLYYLHAHSMSVHIISIPSITFKRIVNVLVYVGRVKRRVTLITNNILYRIYIIYFDRTDNNFVYIIRRRV